jgi:hypothetical protein
MESVHPFFLGAPYVRENVGAHLARAATENLGRLGLGPDRVRFVMVHLDADVERLLDSASRAAAFWVHRNAFVSRT